MSVRNLVIIMGLIAFIKNFALGASDDVGSRIYYRGEKDYVAVIKTVKFSEREAREVLKEALKNKGGAYFDPPPYLFVNGEYLFGIPEKDRLPLTGYYVNATSGSVILRVSKLSVTRERCLPANAYTSEERIR